MEVIKKKVMTASNSIMDLILCRYYSVTQLEFTYVDIDENKRCRFFCFLYVKNR